MQGGVQSLSVLVFRLLVRRLQLWVREGAWRWLETTESSGPCPHSCASAKLVPVHEGLCFQWGMLPHKSCPVGCRHEDVELLSDACLGWFVLEDFLSKSSS